MTGPAGPELLLSLLLAALGAMTKVFLICGVGVPNPAFAAPPVLLPLNHYGRPS